MGSNIFIGVNVYLDLAEKIIIEDDVVIASNVKILTHQTCGDRPQKHHATFRWT